jgi:alkylhydroperoxidase/carboxymuconolactone decarboxylase family protein YurZ
MPEDPLKILEKLDPKLLKLVKDTRDFAHSEGVLPQKFKFLIAMALDASHGTAQGTLACARGAMQAGATKEEIMETFRVVQYICGVGTVYTAAQALEQLLQSERIK